MCLHMYICIQISVCWIASHSSLFTEFIIENLPIHSNVSVTPKSILNSAFVVILRHAEWTKRRAHDPS